MITKFINIAYMVAEGEMVMLSLYHKITLIHIIARTHIGEEN